MIASPLVDVIAKKLSDRIAAGRYQDKEGFPSERELIEEFSVSRAIIRKSLDLLETEGLLSRAPRCKTVVRHPGQVTKVAPPLKRRSIALGILPNPTDAGASAIMQGICKQVNQSSYRLMVGNFSWESLQSATDSERNFLERLLEDDDIAGVVLWSLGGESNLAALNKLRAANIPILFVDRRPPVGFAADYIGVDNEKAAEQMVTHLVESGHRRIAHITNGDQGSTVAERLNGYRVGLMKAGLPFDPGLIVSALESSESDIRAMYASLTERLLSLANPPTAVFATNDVIAERFIAAVRAQGLRVPEDISVAGFDGLDRWKPSEPFLTTVWQPFELIGRRSIEVLLQRIMQGENWVYQEVKLPVTLSIHGSTLPVVSR